jgi:hypothetical protein
MFRFRSSYDELEKKAKARAASGSTIVLLALFVLVAVFTIGVLGLDIVHNTTSRTSLQNATDAAALAGAAQIVQESVNPSNFQSWNYPDYTYTVTSADVQAAALNRAASNTSDGHPVSSASGVNLNVVYTPAAAAAAGVPFNNGTCSVTATQTILNMFAGIVGAPTAPVTTTSQATSYVTVAGVNPNVTFPIAVSLDTFNGHDGSGNQPLNSSKIGSTITFYLEDPCANAAWTSYNSTAVTGSSAAALDTSAKNYLNSALASVTGSSYNPSTVPAQTVGEPSSSGGTNQNGGIDLWGSLTGAGTPRLAQVLVGSTIILPIVGGDLPFWNQDQNLNGSTFAPGSRQTRPLLGFCAVKVATANWDSANNCLKSFSGTLVKALIKGTPGVINPLINPTSTAANNQDVQALDNLSPGMVQLGTTNLNQQPPSSQLPLTSWYQGYAPPGNNNITEADSSEEAIQPINPAFLTFMQNDMNSLCGGVNFNEGVNYATPPSVTGAIQVKQSPDPSTHPYDQILVDPKSTLTIKSTYSDEVGLNMGNDINGPQYSPSVGVSDINNSPRYEVLDSSLNVVQQWQKIVVGPGASGGLGMSWPFTMNIDPASIGTGEHLIVIHAFDTDLGHGGASQSYGGEAGAPGTPPGGYGSDIWAGDAAFYYLDIQYPTCNTAGGG